MAIIKDILIRGDKGQATVSILVDSGATQSFVARRIADAIATVKSLPIPRSFRLANGEEYIARDVVELELQVAGRSYRWPYLVQDGDNLMDLILGEDQLAKKGLILDYARGVLCPIQPLTPSDRQTGKETRMHDILKRIFARLNKEDSADLTDDDAINMIVEMCQKVSPIASEQVLSLLGLNEAATEAQVQGKILALTHRADVVPAADYNALKLQLHERDKKDALTAAVAEGKITPAERASWEAKLSSNEISLETFAAFVAERPKVVPVGMMLPKEPEQKPEEQQAHTPGEKLLAIAQRIHAEEKIPLAEAMRKAQAQQPALAHEHLTAMRA